MRAAMSAMLSALLLVGGCWDFPAERYLLDGRTPDGALPDGPQTDGPLTDGPLTDQGLALGAECTTPGQCASKNCVEGVCCDDPCTDKCKSCALSGSPGKCAQMPPGSVCGPGTCKENNTTLSGHMVCENADAGVMTCVSATSDHNCAPFACNPTSSQCYRTCSKADENESCPGYYACDKAKHTCYSSCNNKTQCKSGGICNKPNCVKDPSKDAG